MVIWRQFHSILGPSERICLEYAVKSSGAGCFTAPSLPACKIPVFVLHGEVLAVNKFSILVDASVLGYLQNLTYFLASRFCQILCIYFVLSVENTSNLVVLT